MQLPGSVNQQARHLTFDASGTITAGGTTQLLLAEAKSRSLLYIQNISDTAMYVGIGCGFATATLTNGVVTSVAVTNAGFGFTYAPDVAFIGGGYLKPDGRIPNMTSVGIGQPGYDAPHNVAKGHAVLTTGAISSIVVDNGGSAYSVAPYVQITNSLRDPVGACLASTTTGILLPATGGTLFFNYTNCPTDPISIFCASSAKAFICKYMP
jgi:hypothetical protein